MLSPADIALIRVVNLNWHVTMVTILIFYFLLEAVATLPINPRSQGIDSKILTGPPFSGMGHHPIWDDETTTTVKHTPSTTHVATTMTLDRFDTIRRIKRYQQLLRQFLMYKPDVVHTERWHAQSAKVKVSDDDLNNMSTNELHGLLNSIKHFYNATLGNLCCPLG